MNSPLYAFVPEDGVEIGDDCDAAAAERLVFEDWVPGVDEEAELVDEVCLLLSSS